MRTFAAVLLIAVATLAGAQSTTNNDDWCDIGITPAATLLILRTNVNP